MKFNPPSIISDEPLKRDLGFGFDTYAQTLAEVVANKKNSTPLVLGIYGSWGSGKTTLMNGIEAELQRINAQFVERDWPGKDVYRPTKTVWFQAWKYQEEDAILAALIDEIIKMIRADAPLFGAVKTKLEEWGKTVEVKGAVGQLISWFTAGTVDLKEIFPDPEFRKKLGFYHDFIRFFDGLIWAALTDSGIKDAKEFDDRKGALVVFIDDLDRCPQPRVLKVLETIKLFLDKKGCVFIIGAAQDVIEHALQERYGKEDDIKRFMDKIVQVTFALPQPTEQEIGDYFTTNMGESGIPAPYHKLIAQSLQFNVRSVKRFLNNLSLRRSLAAKAKVDLGTHANAMIPWTILELGHSALAHLIRLSPRYVTDMQQAAQDLERHVKQQGRQNDQWFVDEAAFEQAKVIHPLRPFLTNREIIDLVNQLPSDNKTLRSLIGLTATVGTIEQEEPTRKEAGLREGPIGLKDMVKIPPGPFLYGEKKDEKMIDQPFFMDVYPVTNSQFRQFMEAGGYDNETFWSSEEGLKWKQKEKVSAPRYWEDEQWNQPDHPVVGISWYEAQAFAAWAGKRLPTEVEWERAARGTGGLEYPWGNEFDPERCNSAKSKIGKTTPVTKYPEGRSPEGCFDMAGNVWEWAIDWYDSNKDTKVFRGGSWFNGAGVLRSSNRLNGIPTNGFNVLGFRCARDAPPDGT